MPLEEVFQTLRCDEKGLTTEAAQERLAIFGHNKLEEKKVFPFKFFILFFFLSIFLFSGDKWLAVADVKWILFPLFSARKDTDSIK